MPLLPPVRHWVTSFYTVDELLGSIDLKVQQYESMDYTTMGRYKVRYTALAFTVSSDPSDHSWTGQAMHPSSAVTWSFEMNSCAETFPGCSMNPKCESAASSTTIVCELRKDWKQSDLYKVLNNTTAWSNVVSAELVLPPITQPLLDTKQDGDIITWHIRMSYVFTTHGSVTGTWSCHYDGGVNTRLAMDGEHSAQYEVLLVLVMVCAAASMLFHTRALYLRTCLWIKLREIGADPQRIWEEVGLSTNDIASR